MTNKRSKLVIYPGTQKVLAQMGHQIKLARLRRNITAELVAKRAGISQTSVWAVEKGSPTVSMGIYAAVLNAIGMDKELLKIAKDDELGHALQDAGLKVAKRARK